MPTKISLATLNMIGKEKHDISIPDLIMNKKRNIF